MNEYRHKGVMTERVVELLNVRPIGIYFDATLGGGEHSEAILKRGASVIATDMDDKAIDFSKRLKDKYGKRFKAYKRNFAEVDSVLKEAETEKVDGVVADLGISSAQLEDQERGFSFNSSGPLDMRFDTSSKYTAYDLMRDIKTEDLARALFEFADIKKADKIAKYIKLYFERGMKNSAALFAEYIRECRYLPRSRKIDPATTVFMAIRMLVNDEIKNLMRFLSRLPMIVRDGAVIVIITFHSVEDRIVKRMFRRFTGSSFLSPHGNMTAELLNRKVITPTEEEVRRNPRSRSAKLRAIRFFSAERED